MGPRLEIEEMMRLQGMDPTEFTVAVTDTQLRKQLGNAMSVNVLERLLVCVLPAAGLVKHGALVDRWKNGEAVRRLTETIGMGFKEDLKPVATNKVTKAIVYEPMGLTSQTVQRHQFRRVRPQKRQHEAHPQ